MQAANPYHPTVDGPYVPSAFAGRSDAYSIIIDGLYGFGEYKLLNQGLGTSMVVVAIVADRALRYQRLTQRPVRPLTPTEAIERDIREIEHLEKGGPIAIADYTLLNNAGTGDLLQQLDTLLAKLGMQP
jgi:dephospho-CoA kinase